MNCLHGLDAGKTGDNAHWYDPYRGILEVGRLVKSSMSVQMKFCRCLMQCKGMDIIADIKTEVE